MRQQLNKLLHQRNRKLLYAFTPDKYANNDTEIINCVISQCKAGVDILQLREKRKSPRELLALAKKIREITAKFNVIFIVNDDLSIAQLSNADGVHLGQDDIPVSEARMLLGNKKIIGLSTHNIKQYKLAQTFDCIDYTAIGPIFKTTTKDNPSPVVGLSKLNNILKYKQKFTVAIGGINLENIDKIAKFQEIDAIAIVSAIVSSTNINFTVKQITTKISNTIF